MYIFNHKNITNMFNDKFKDFYPGFKDNYQDHIEQKNMYLILKLYLHKWQQFSLFIRGSI